MRIFNFKFFRPYTYEDKKKIDKRLNRILDVAFATMGAFIIAMATFIILNVTVGSSTRVQKLIEPEPVPTTEPPSAYLSTTTPATAPPADTHTTTLKAWAPFAGVPPAPTTAQPYSSDCGFPGDIPTEDCNPAPIPEELQFPEYEETILEFPDGNTITLPTFPRS